MPRIKATLPLGNYTEFEKPEDIRDAITKLLVQFFGELPTYKVESLTISQSSWQLVVRLKDINSGSLNYPKT